MRAGFETILFGERVGKKDPKNPEDHGWTALYDGRKSNPRIDKTNLLGEKSVIFFPGDGVISEQGANGCCKAVEGMLLEAGLPKKSKPHLYGVAYKSRLQDDHRRKILTQLKQNKLGQEYVLDNFWGEISYYQAFFDEYILPLMVDESGKPRSTAEIRKNIQNVTFVTHCHGGFMAYQIEKMMADKLMEFYPKQMPELMGNVRMIHFSSRRPQGQTYAKHLDVISQNDSKFADESYLEYDNIQKQLHRASLSAPTALIPTSPNEEILLLKKLANDELKTKNGKEIELDINQDPDHSSILKIFSGEFQNPFPENTVAIQLVCQLLRHFVEHPEDKKGLEDQLKELNCSFVEENVERGKSLLAQEKENENQKRGLLSLLSDPKLSSVGAIRTYKRKVHKLTQTDKTKQIKKSPISEEIKETFLERNSQGVFLYDDLKKQYEKTGDSRSLIRYLKDNNAVTLLDKGDEKGNLAVLAVKNSDWALFRMLGGLYQSAYKATPDQLGEIIASVSPDNLYHLFHFLTSDNVDGVKKRPDTTILLMRKIKKIKKVLHKKQLEDFFKKSLIHYIFRRGIDYPEKDEFVALLRLASMQEKKFLKSLLAKPRKERADKLFAMMRERDQFAPELRLTQMVDYYDQKNQIGDYLTLQTYREFCSLKQKPKDLTLYSFCKEKYQENQNKNRELSGRGRVT